MKYKIVIPFIQYFFFFWGGVEFFLFLYLTWKEGDRVQKDKDYGKNLG
jgi:hypothetical protein